MSKGALRKKNTLLKKAYKLEQVLRFDITLFI
jgi:hypothetical protein